MAIDRAATLKSAEKFLRAGRLDAAITEYARIVEDQPGDWNTANTLGDLYARAGQLDRALGLYRRVAEHLLAEGFYPKAAALFKKVLKMAPQGGPVEDVEAAQLRLAEISVRQGLMAEARSYYSAVANQRRQRGDISGADDILVRLGALDPEDLEARRAAAQAAERSGQLAAAAGLYRELHDDCLAQGQESAALTALRHFLRCDPGLAAGKSGHGAVIELAWSLAGQNTDAAALCLEAVADALSAAEDFEEAAALLRDFASRVPGHIPMLLRLVEVCVDGGLERAMYEAQAQLAEAYLAAGRTDDARVLAEDLMASAPLDEASITRLQRAAQRPPAVVLPADPRPPAAVLPADPRPPVAAPPADSPEAQADAEIDLTGLLGDLNARPAAPEQHPRESRDLDDVFAGLRADAGRDAETDDSDEHFSLAGTYLDMDMPQERSVRCRSLPGHRSIVSPPPRCSRASIATTAI